MSKFIDKKFFFAPRVGRVRHLSMTFTWFALIALCLLIDVRYHLTTRAFAVTSTLIAIGIVNLLFLSMRRLNDVDMTRAWIFVYFVPFGVLFYIATFLMQGTPAANRYGEPSIMPMFWDYLLLVTAPLAVITAFVILH